MSRPRVVVVGLGPGGPDLVTAGTLAAIERVPSGARYVRTSRHPSAAVVGAATAFDDIYETAESIDDVYPTIVAALVTAADLHGEVLYAVPGSPAVAERTVVLLREHPGVDVEVVPALSFADLAWARLGVDPLAAGVRIIDGHRFAVDAAGERGPLLVAQCDSPAVLSEVKLALDLDGPPVTVLQRLGLPGEAVFERARADLDRSFEPDHLTSLYLADAAPAVASEVARFDQLVHVLRERCPWDRSQTHSSLTRHLLEETYEVLEAIEGLPESYHHLEEELGDLLFQICFHTTLATEQGAFTLDDVARGIHDKLVGRHPHVFAKGPSGPLSGEHSEHPGWEELKKTEKGRASVFDGMPGHLPSLLYAYKVVGKAGAIGADVPPPAEVTPEHIGDALLALVVAARALDIDPESALRATADKLRRLAAAHESSPNFGSIKGP